jgi:hypothetical protein
MKITKKVRSATVLAGLTLAASGAVAAIAPTAALAISACQATLSPPRTAFAVCQNLGAGKKFRAVARCEKLTSGNSIFVNGQWVTNSGTSAAVCGVDWTVQSVAIEYS